MNKQRLAEYRTSLTSIREMDFTNMGKKGLSFIENQLYSIGIALAESTHAEDKAVVAEATMLLREHESIQNQVRVSGKANGSTGSIRESLDGVFGEAGQAEVTTSGKLVEGLVEKGKELKGLKESAELKLERAIKIIEGIREEYKKLEKSHLSMIEKAKSWKGKVLAKVTERLDRYKTQMSGMSENLTTANLKIKALEKLKEAQRVTESKVIHGVPPVKKPTNLSEGKGAPVPANGESPKKLSEGVAMANSLKARTGFRY